MVKLDDAPWKNPPPKELTDAEIVEIRRAVDLMFARSRLRDAIAHLRNLGREDDAIAVKAILETLGEVSDVT